MKKLTFSILLLLTGSLWQSARAQQAPPDTASSRSTRQIFTVTEVPPQFPGGMSQLGEYMRKNLRYPEGVRKASRKSKVFVRFLVTDEGRIEEARVLKNGHPQLDAEAVRLIENMPTWIPARQRGRAVTCEYNLPVDFSLNGNR